jgi:hypothetical protein
MKKEKSLEKTSASSFLKAQAFADAQNRISLDPRVPPIIAKKLAEALCKWAMMKMGTKRPQYLQGAYGDFHVKCTQIVAETNRDIGEVVEEIPFEIPLHLSKKRPPFTGQVFYLYLIAAEYEQVLLVVKSAKAGMFEAAQFRLNLKEELKRFASEQNLEPIPDKDLDKMLKRYNERTSPFQIAQDYVGYKRCISGAAVKKLLVIARDPKRMSASLGKYFKKAYQPKNFDAILQSLMPPQM